MKLLPLLLVAGIAWPAAPEFVTVPRGTLTIRDTPTGFTFEVTVDAFLAGVSEVTQGEYARVAGAHRSHFAGAELPVENVTWWEAIRYANRRSVLENLQPCYDLTTGRRRQTCEGYRLPTSAEWTRMTPPKPVAGDSLRTGGHKDEKELMDVRTRPASVGEGIRDLYGNVWEWCEDWYFADPIVDAIRNPRGPLYGLEKVVRGGSALTAASSWNRGFASSAPPDRRSPFVGFRVVRSIRAVEPAQKIPQAAVPHSELEQRWRRILGEPKLPARAPAARVIESMRQPSWQGQLIDLQVEPNFPDRILVMEPANKPAGRLPVLIVPYYDVDTPAGTNLGGRRFTPGGERAFGLLAVQRGYIAVAIRWFGEGDAEGYDEAV